MGKRRSGSRPGSKDGSGLEPTQRLAGDSSGASNWQLKYMENVLTCNSQQSLQKQQENGSLIGTFAAQRSAASESKDS